ncbi:helix-turn-helix domain-containing protein [Mycobacteroides abscessus]|uniref:helix-turn-helix domain-containing protein n=1 Tax=Mycobacteroides abscessus TaxID=36809 RepID=UPI0013001241
MTFGAISYSLGFGKRNHYAPFVACADISAPRIKGVFSVSLYTAPVQSRSQPVVPGKKPGRLLSTNQAAEYLGVSSNTIRKYSAAGKIKAFRVGVKLIKYDPADLDAFKQQVGGR